MPETDARGPLQKESSFQLASLHVFAKSVPFLGLSVFGWLPILAGAAMALSSVTVVGNSMLLGRYKPRYAAVKPQKQRIYTDKELKEVHTEAT